MNINDAAIAAVEDYPGGASSLAPRMGMGASTLSHEVSGTHKAKLGARTAARIARLTGDVRLVEAFVQEAGFNGIFFSILPADDQVPGVEHVTRMVKELSDVATSFGKALEDGKVTHNERDKFMREAGELIAAVNRACEFVEAHHRASMPGGAA